MRSLGRFRFGLYLILLVLRLIATLQPGYIHPDEFFQGGQELFFGCNGHDTNSHYGGDAGVTVADADGAIDGNNNSNNNNNNIRMRISTIYTSTVKAVEIDNDIHGILGGIRGVSATWEFQREHALRSIMPPIVMTLLPLRLYSFWKRTAVSVIFGLGLSSGLGPFEIPHGHSADADWGKYLSGWEIFLIPRLFMALLSIVTMDIPLWYISKRRYRYRTKPVDECASVSVPVEVLLFASSWVTLGFLNRPFSNTLETMCLSVLCFIATYDGTSNVTSTGMNTQRQRRLRNYIDRYEQLQRWVLPIAIGIVGAIGIFTRFTFAIFALPVVISLLSDRFYYYYTASSNDQSSKDQKKVACIWHGALMTGVTIFVIAIAFVSTSASFIYADATFYMSQQTCERSSMDELSSSQRMPLTLSDISSLITPWNALRYNSKVDNLSEHGLHPRTTHALANLPMLYGPLALLFYWEIIQRVKKPVDITNGSTRRQMRANDSDHMFFAMLMMGLGVLSCAPHQEPRFLLPLVVPLILLLGRHFEGEHTLKNASVIKKGLAIFWVIFNALLLIFFGGLHQGAVVPSLLSLPKLSAEQDQPPSAIVTYHTYMPPTFLMNEGAAANGVKTVVEADTKTCSRSMEDCIDDEAFNISSRRICNSVPLFDLKGADQSELFDFLQNVLLCQEYDKHWIYLLMPMTCMDDGVVPSTNEATNSFWKQYDIEEKLSSFQISTEDMPSNASFSTFSQESKLVVYQLRCKALII